MKVYFDSCIWISHLWNKHIAEKETKKVVQIQNILKKISSKEVQVVTSLFISTEVSSHFRDWYILQKVVAEGRAFREFSKLKKQKQYNDLSEIQKQTINECVEEITRLPYVVYHEIGELDKKALDLFSTLTSIYHVEFPDALHMVVAMLAQCKFLLTEDNEMRESGNQFLEDNKLAGEFRLVGISEFGALLE